MPAKLIAFEGLDCSFKETNSVTLLRYLESLGHEAYLYAFPRYGEKSVYFVDQFLKGGYNLQNNTDLNPYSISLFYALDRFDKWEKEIKPIYESRNDAIIILDRWTMSNMFFQSARSTSLNPGNLDPVSFVHVIENSVLKLPVEDLTIFMDVPYDLSREILANRHKETKTTDTNESNNEFMKAVYDNSPKVIDYINEQAWGANIHTVDCAMRTDDEEVVLKSKREIFNQVATIVNDYLLGGK